MNRTVSVGFGNYVAAGRIVAILSPDSAPVKRKVAQAKEAGMAVDASFGRKTRAVVLCDNGQVVLSGLSADTIAHRIEELTG